MMTDNDQGYKKTALKSLFHVGGIYSVHYFKYSRTFSYEGEAHDFWEFVYIDAGQARITAGDETITLHQSEAVFHAPGEYHNIATDERFANSVILSFSCDSPAMRRFAGHRCILDEEARALLNRIVTECRAAFSGRLDDMYQKQLYRHKTAPAGTDQMIRTYIEQLLILLYRKTESSGVALPHKTRSADELTGKILEVLKENLYGDISLDELSERLYFSKTYIKSVFKKQTGSAIMHYFAQMKTEEAKRLISENRYTFTEIAYKLGFASLPYFSRVFKSHTQMTPSEYSRSVQIDNLL